MVNHGELATEIDVNLVDVVKVLKDTDYKEMVQQVGSAVAAVKTVLDEAEISSKDLLTMNFESIKSDQTIKPVPPIIIKHIRVVKTRK